MLIKLCQPPKIIGMKNNTNSKINKKICLKVKFERIKRGLSQEQLAELADLNKNTIGNIERSEGSPTIDTLERIAKAFNMEFIELVDTSKVDL